MTSGCHRNTAGNQHKGHMLALADYTAGGTPDRTETGVCLPECNRGSIPGSKMGQDRFVQVVLPHRLDDAYRSCGRG
jgi:hypothetical protein